MLLCDKKVLDGFAIDMPLALIGILWSMGAKAWTVTYIVLILLFMAWGIFMEVGCYRNSLVPEGFVKKGKQGI